MNYVTSYAKRGTFYVQLFCKAAVNISPASFSEGNDGWISRSTPLAHHDVHSGRPDLANVTGIL